MIAIGTISESDQRGRVGICLFPLAEDDFVDFLAGILFSRFDHSGIPHPGPAFIRGDNVPQ